MLSLDHLQNIEKLILSDRTTIRGNEIVAIVQTLGAVQAEIQLVKRIEEQNAKIPKDAQKSVGAPNTSTDVPVKMPAERVKEVA